MQRQSGKQKNIHPGAVIHFVAGALRERADCRPGCLLPPRRSYAQVLLGDWKCPGCDDHQYANNPECRSCGRLHPIGAGARSAAGLAELAAMTAWPVPGASTRMGFSAGSTRPPHLGTVPGTWRRALTSEELDA